jgi:regulator of RNase E activity RraA
MTATGDPGPQPELIARLAPLATSTLANALDEVGLGDNVAAGIAAVAPGLRCAGPALTVKEVSGEFGSFPSSDFKIGAVIEAARAGDVIVIDTGGARISTWGGMASYAARLKGVAGLVVDGGVRDLEEIVEFGFAVFARHLVPTTGRTRLKVEAIGEPVEIGSVGVAPGDLVVADGTGVVCLPAGRAAEIVALAERFAADDAAAMADLEAGMTFAQAMQKYRKI